MKLRQIDELIRLKLGTFADAGIPEPQYGKRWSRFPCPFCDSKDKRAASISFTAGRFRCFACGTRISERDEAESAISEFQDQIAKAFFKVQQKFPGVVYKARIPDYKDKAKELVWEYEVSGKIAEWDEKCGGNMAKLKGYEGYSGDRDVM
jgi:hypothetical protein